MNYRPIGRTGWRVSDISFRAWAIAGNWGQASERDALAALNKAVESGALDGHRNFHRHGESFDAPRSLRYEPMNPRWEIAEFEHHPHDWSQARRCIVARRRIEENDPEPTLFTLERYAYRAGHTNRPGFGTSTMAAPEWSHSSENFVRTMRSGRFPLVFLRPMHSI